MKKQKACIFCGQTRRISKEHFWPKWFGQLSKASSDTHFIEVYAGEGRMPQNLSFMRQRPGDVTSIKIRVVCEECNNVWMSGIENKFKTIFSNIMDGSLKTLNKEQINIVTLWACIKSIISEYPQPNTILTPAPDRFNLMNNNTIPDYFAVYLGMHSSETKAAFARTAIAILQLGNGYKPILAEGMTRNFQTVSFLIGPLFFHIIALRETTLDATKIFKFNNLVSVWPTPPESIDLNKLKVINNGELQAIANSVHTFTGRTNYPPDTLSPR